MHILYNTTKDVCLQHAGNLIYTTQKRALLLQILQVLTASQVKDHNNSQKMGVVVNIVHKSDYGTLTSLWSIQGDHLVLIPVFGQYHLLLFS